ncbi:MAG: hypothetical protein LAQ69_41810 [Acidobacteriia bacterium]|nr:hypothetical protein [Terriglobia bacterium]
MTNLQRRLQRLEAHLTDLSGLVPKSQKWLEYWDRQIYDYMTNEQAEPVRFSVEAVRAVMKFMSDPESSVGSIPAGIDE